MSKEIVKRPQEISNKAAWYKSALLPWVIIVVLMAFVGGAVMGWTARSNQVADVKAEVASQLASQAPVKK